MITHTQLTAPQSESIKRLKENGLHILEIHPEIGFNGVATGPVMVKCKSKFNGFELWYGIETDGYAHS
ncbi:hypothetical protein UFOVP144_36 [uncultured Caudovirales phage]|uniref:Uncharacterized protein n=1 Tax=uncultured Caudovirales phage TaxID=2100421 RepID=A0A6J7XNF9_9CAUD|nr:hypothetical protein UFOVP144_36 [uncultured Caudovirales phage]